MTTLPSTASPLVLHTLYGETMGTRWRVDLHAPGSEPLDLLHGAVQARLDAIVSQMSSWEPDSDLCRFNRAPAGSWHVLPDDFFRVMDCALQVAYDSAGAFDPAIGALVGVSVFGARTHAHRACPSTRRWPIHAPLQAGASCGSTVPHVDCCNPAGWCWICRRSRKATAWTRWSRCCASAASSLRWWRSAANCVAMAAS